MTVQVLVSTLGTLRDKIEVILGYKGRPCIKRGGGALQLQLPSAFLHSHTSKRQENLVVVNPFPETPKG